MNKKILVVDDERALVDYLTLRLEKKGYRTCFSYDGESALDAAGKESPDLILLDIRLPGISGFQVFERLRRNPELMHIPVIFVTADSTVLEENRPFKSSADDFLIKPFEPEELYEKIEAKLGPCEVREEPV